MYKSGWCFLTESHMSLDSRKLEALKVQLKAQGPKDFL